MARGYHSYRGRRSTGTKVMIAVLLLILLAACAFMMLQGYASYTDDGQVQFNFPSLLDFFRHDEDEPPPDDTGDEDPGPEGQDINLTIGENGEQQPEDPENVPEPAPEERRLVLLGELPADSAALQNTLAAAGANGFVYPARDETGRVFYDSATAADKASVVDAAGTAELSGLCAEGGLAVARFNCFHDSYYAFIHMKEAAICQKTGYVWYDNKSYHWLDPGKEEARSYVIGLAEECVKLGFDELLLEELAYPTKGKLEKIDYSGNTMEKTEALTLFLTELRTALEPYGTRISLLVSEELLQAGGNEESGEDLTALLPLVDAVYAEVSDAAGTIVLLQQYAGDNAVPDFVPLVRQAGAGAWCLTETP